MALRTKSEPAATGRFCAASRVHGVNMPHASTPRPQILERMAKAAAALKDAATNKRGRDGVKAANGGRPDKRTKQPAAANAAPRATAAAADEVVATMTRICKQVGIRISPHVYKQPDRRAALAELLAKHGLSASSSAASRSPRPSPQACC